MSIALYARKSIERENSISCETQLEYCRAKVMPDERDENILEFVDNGFSGGNVNRDGFQRMMRDISLGKIRKVIVYRLDRISRSLADFLSILDVFKKYDVEFISAQEAFDTGSPYGELIVKILAVFAEFERQSIIQRVTQAYEHRSELGIYMGGRKPFGFELEPTNINNIATKKLSPVKDEIECVKYIFQMYARENVTLRSLQDYLIEKKCFPRSGGWSTSKLSAILKNPIYVKADNLVYKYFLSHNARIISDISAFDGIHGVQIYGKTKRAGKDLSDVKVVVLTHSGVVSSEVWIKCQEKLEKNKRFGTSVSNGTSWLGGIIACKNCGRTMTVTKGRKKTDGSQGRYFNCTGKTHNRMCQGVGVPIYADSLEELLHKLIGEKMASFAGCRIKLSSGNTKRVNSLKNRVCEIEKEEGRLVDLILQGTSERDIETLFRKKASVLAVEKKKLLEEIKKIELCNSEAVDVQRLVCQWQKAGADQKKAISKILVHKIYVDGDGSVEIVWNI